VVWVAGVLVVVVIAGVVAWRLWTPRSEFEQAVADLPASTLRTTYTDWTVVRQQAGGSSLGPSSPRGKVDAFLNRAYDGDLTSGSAIDESTYALQKKYGFSPLGAQWEVFGQGRHGQVDVVRLVDGADTDAIERRLRALGYTAPSGGAGSGGTWAGSSDLVSQIDPDLTPVEQNVVVLPDQKLVLMSDSTTYVTSAAKVITGSATSLADVEGIDDLSGIAKDPAAAVMWSSTFACEDLSMGKADPGDQRVGEQLVAKAGKVSPLEGVVMAQQADRTMRVGLHFETKEQASSNLQTRVDLASGEAPGQGGSFADRFTVTAGTADGSDVVLTLRLKRGQSVLSDLSSGPVLFVTC
jgi:hypothetical protein